MQFNEFLDREVAKLFISPFEQTYFVWLDILGFKQTVYGNSSEKLKQIVNTFIEKFDLALDASRTLEYKKVDLHTHKESETKDKIAISHDLNFRIFSDSVIMWTNDSSHRLLSHLLYALCEIMKESFRIRMPLRGVLTYGDLFTVNKPSNYFLTNEAIYGKALVDAYSLEGKMEWAGCVVSPNVWEQIKKKWNDVSLMKTKHLESPYDYYFLAKPLLTWYEIPWKDELKNKISTHAIALNWTYQINYKETLSPEEVLNAFLHDRDMTQLSEDIKRKLLNTFEFYLNQIYIDNDNSLPAPKNYNLY